MNNLLLVHVFLWLSTLGMAQSSFEVKVRPGESYKVNNLSIFIEDIITEKIEPDSKGYYPSGTGVTVYLQLSTGFETEDMALDKLSLPYSSNSVGIFMNYRIVLAHYDNDEITLSITDFMTIDFFDKGLSKLPTDHSSFFFKDWEVKRESAGRIRFIQEGRTVFLINKLDDGRISLGSLLKVRNYLKEKIFNKVWIDFVLF